MEKMNYEEKLSKLAMDKAKDIAQSLNENWRGIDGNQKSTNAGSYVDGIKKAVLNETNSNTEVAPKKGFYSLGLNNTILALRNTSLNDLPEGKIMLERYLNDLNIKGVPEVYLFESFLRDISNFSWETNAKATLANLTKIYEANVREILVLKTIADLKNSGGRELFSGLSESLVEWLMSPNRVSETLLFEMKKWAFTPAIKGLINNISILENKSSNKLNIKSDNSNCEVKRIIAPSMVFESYTIHSVGGRFLKIGNGNLSIMEKKEVAKLPGRFLNAVLALKGSDIRINESGVEFVAPRTKVSVVFEGGEKKVYLNGRNMPLESLGTTLSIEFRNYFGNSAPIVERVMNMIKYADDLAELDFAKSIKSKVYEGVEANLFKIGKKIYVQRVNPGMKKNELFEANGNQTVNLVKEFIGFDISESLTEFLDGETRIKSIMYNDKKTIADNMKIVESEMAKIETVINSNPLVANAPEILAAKEMLANESEILKSRWNEINVEIERFEKGSKKIEINETGTYGIDTEVKIKRNGVKGHIIGINGNSKTYTIMTEKGGSGEYFFSDVINVADEIEKVDINPVVEGADIDNLKNMNLADILNKDTEKVVNKPSGTSAGTFASEKIGGKDKMTGGKKGAKDIDNENNMNLATLKFKEASGKVEGPTGIQGKSNMANILGFKGGAGKAAPKEVKGTSKEDNNMAKMPGGNAKGGTKDINKESSMNLGKLPKVKAKTGAKDIDNEKNMKLGELPKGEKKKVVNKPSGTSAGSIKNKLTEGKEQKNAPLAVAPGKSAPAGKKFIEKASDSNMAKIPGSTKHNGKPFHNNLKNSNLAKAPGKSAGTLKMLNGKIKRSK